MYKSKIKLLVVTFIIVIISLFSINNTYASFFGQNKESDDYKVIITSDTKDFRNTQDNVVNGKIAPGCKTYINYNVELKNTDFNKLYDLRIYPDIELLPKCFSIKVLYNGEEYESGNSIIIFGSEVSHIFTVEVIWNDNDNNLDTVIGTSMEQIVIPVTATIYEL